ARLPTANFRRPRQDRQSLLRKFWDRRRSAEIQGHNGIAERNGGRLIRRVLFNRLSAANLLSRFASAAVAGSPFVDFLEDVGDHRGRGRAAVNFASHVALIKRGEGVLRFLRRQKSSKPRGGTLLIFRAPLRGASLARDLDAIQLRFVPSAVRPIH